MEEPDLIPHLFRTEHRKIVSVLCRTLGIDHLETAEDLVNDTFLLAAETWGLKGLPANPTAWLYNVARNKAIDYLRRAQLFNSKIAPALNHSSDKFSEPEFDWSGKSMEDSQLRMMFAICHPSIPAESQVGLSLSILCGFGAEEIADAFLTNRDTIYKRLVRAKEKLRQGKINLELPSPSQLLNRLETVLTTLYLLFSEGYYSASQNITLRKELCIEAMRLTLMLTENELTNIPATNALLALMCFHSSRFDARTDLKGDLILYEKQDETLWNRELINKGERYLNRASQGKKLSKYHLEAAIAYWHTHKADSPEKWENILQLYNKLLQLEYSPVAALNRTFALSKANSKEEAIVEAEKLHLEGNHLYYSLLGRLYMDVNNSKALENWIKARKLAKTEGDRKVIDEYMKMLSSKPE